MLLAVQVLLPVMIYTAGPISGAHFNPMVTSVFMMARMQVHHLAPAVQIFICITFCGFEC